MHSLDLNGGPPAGGDASRFDLLIFDCDGVLVDSEILSLTAYDELLRSIGIVVSEDDLLGCIGLKQADIFARLEGLSGRSIPPEARATLWPRIRALFEAALKPTEGLVDFLRPLTTKRCVASSSDPDRIKLSLRLTGLAAYFGGAVFSTHQVRRGKPAPDIYLFAAEQLQCRPPRCLVIEDSAPGVEGARAAGMTAIGFAGGAHVRDGHADRLAAAGAAAVFTNWAGVSEWLARGAVP